MVAANFADIGSRSDSVDAPSRGGLGPSINSLGLESDRHAHLQHPLAGRGTTAPAGLSAAGVSCRRSQSIVRPSPDGRWLAVDPSPEIQGRAQPSRLGAAQAQVSRAHADDRVEHGWRAGTKRHARPTRRGPACASVIAVEMDRPGGGPALTRKACNRPWFYAGHRVGADDGVDSCRLQP